MLASDIRDRNILKIEGKICQVIERNIAGTGKFGKTIHLRLKNLEDGHTLEHRFRAEEKVDRIDVEQHPMEFLYKDGSNFVFMDEASYEQFSLPERTVGNVAAFLKENTKINVIFHENKPIHIDFPKTIDMRVASSPPAMGSGQDNTFKEVEIENGLKILVPQFIKAGDFIRIDVEHRKYLERIQEK